MDNPYNLPSWRLRELSTTRPPSSYPNQFIIVDEAYHAYSTGKQWIKPTLAVVRTKVQKVGPPWVVTGIISVIANDPNTAVPVTGVSISPKSAALKVGQQQQLTATVSPPNATTPGVTFASSNAAVVSVNPTTGLATMLTPGFAVTTVTTVDGQFIDSCTFTVTAVVVETRKLGMLSDSRGFLSFTKPGGMNEFYRAMGIAPAIASRTVGVATFPTELISGVAGDNSEAILARAPALITAMKAAGSTRVLYLGTINDRFAQWTAARSQAAVLATLALFRDANISVDLISETPCGNGVAGSSYQMTTAQKQIHKDMHDWFESLTGVTVHNWWDVWIDPTSGANYYPLASVTEDLIHPSKIGSFLGAKVSGPKFLTALTGLPSMLPVDNTQYSPVMAPQGSLFFNPMMSGTGGTKESTISQATGTAIPDGYKLGATASAGLAVVMSKETITEVSGPVEYFKMRITGTSTTNNGATPPVYTAPVIQLKVTVPITEMAIGDRIKCIASCRHEGSGISDVAISLLLLNMYQVKYDTEDSNAALPYPTENSGRLSRETPAYVRESTVVALELRHEVFLAPNTPVDCTIWWAASKAYKEDLPALATFSAIEKAKISTLALSSTNGSFRVGTIGTSLIQQNDAGTAAKVAHEGRGWADWANVYSQGLWDIPIWWDPTVRVGWEPSGTTGATRYFYGANGGVSGQILDQIAPRIPTLTSQITVDAWIYDGGTNDILTSLTKEEIFAKRTAQIQALLATGKPVFVLPILSRAISSWPSGSDARAKALWINQQTAAWVDTQQRALLLDWNKPWVNPADPDGAPYPAYTPDGIHFQPPGGQAVGAYVASWMRQVIGGALPPFVNDAYNATTNPKGNLYTGALMLGTGGAIGTGVTGSVATGARVERFASTPVGDATGVASKQVVNATIEELQVLTITPGAVDSTFYIRTNAADFAHTLAAGTWVRASIYVEVTANAGWRGVDLYFSDRGTGGLTSFDMEPFVNDSSVPVNLPAVGFKGVLRTVPFQLVTGSVALRYRLEATVAGGATGPLVIAAGRMRFSAVDSPQVLLNYTP